MYNKSVSVISGIESDIGAIEKNEALYQEINFDSRADASDFIDFHILDRIEGLMQGPDINEQLHVLKLRAEKIKHGLENIDANLFRQLREKVSAGIYTGSSFRDMIHEHVRYDVNDSARQGKIGYDTLDIFINALLADHDIPEPIIEREPEMVFYQKTPARIVFLMAELAQLGPDDVFYDIGSGLGQVAILVNLITGAAARGIEYEPAYCN